MIHDVTFILLLLSMFVRPVNAAVVLQPKPIRNENMFFPDNPTAFKTSSKTPLNLKLTSLFPSGRSDGAAELRGRPRHNAG